MDGDTYPFLHSFPQLADQFRPQINFGMNGSQYTCNLQFNPSCHSFPQNQMAMSSLAAHTSNTFHPLTMGFQNTSLETLDLLGAMPTVRFNSLEWPLSFHPTVFQQYPQSFPTLSSSVPQLLGLPPLLLGNVIPPAYPLVDQDDDVSEYTIEHSENEAEIDTENDPDNASEDASENKPEVVVQEADSTSAHDHVLVTWGTGQYQVRTSLKVALAHPLPVGPPSLPGSSDTSDVTYSPRLRLRHVCAWIMYNSTDDFSTDACNVFPAGDNMVKDSDIVDVTENSIDDVLVSAPCLGPQNSNRPLSTSEAQALWVCSIGECRKPDSTTQYDTGMKAFIVGIIVASAMPLQMALEILKDAAPQALQLKPYHLSQELLSMQIAVENIEPVNAILHFHLANCHEFRASALGPNNQIFASYPEDMQVDYIVQHGQLPTIAQMIGTFTYQVVTKQIDVREIKNPSLYVPKKRKRSIESRAHVGLPASPNNKCTIAPPNSPSSSPLQQPSHQSSLPHPPLKEEEVDDDDLTPSSSISSAAVMSPPPIRDSVIVHNSIAPPPVKRACGKWHTYNKK